MTQANRKIYGSALQQTCTEVLKHFTIAFVNRHTRKDHLEEAIGLYMVLREDIDLCTRENIIHYTNKGGSTEDYVRLKKEELFMIVAKIDNDLGKWYASVSKDKTIID